MSSELPPPQLDTESKGIHQSDIIIQSAVAAGLQDLRQNPNLLNRVWASLPQDLLTRKDYGQKSLEAARKWFLSTHIPVQVVPHVTEAKYPCISILLASSAEVPAEATLGDVHEPSAETNDQSWPASDVPVTPSAYDPGTGIVTLPVAMNFSLGSFFCDRTGTPHEILEVLSETEFRVATGTVADFRGAIIRPPRPAWIEALESSSFRETYSIGLHVSGDPVHLVWLHSIIVFILLRYKEHFMEARGFERSTFTSAEMGAVPEYGQEGGEPIWSRYIQCSGFVRQYWPKAITERITGVELDEFKVSGAYSGDPGPRPNTTPGPDVSLADTGTDVDTALWMGNRDSLSKPRR